MSNNINVDAILKSLDEGNVVEIEYQKNPNVPSRIIMARKASVEDTAGYSNTILIEEDGALKRLRLDRILGYTL